MAYGVNPLYGVVPGAPYGLHGWNGNQFQLFGAMPPVPAAAPPPPLAATVTPQDVAAQSAFVAPRTDTGGAQPGGGGPGTGPGGIGGASGGGQDLTTSGYPGVYAQAPDELNSQFGTGMGMAGMLGGGIAGVPGIGTTLGALGGAIDAARYNGINAQYGVPGTVNPWGSAAAAALAGIGIPFTDWNLARLFDVPTARERQNALLDAYGQPLSRADMGYGALQANAPVGPATVGSPPSASYPAGFLDWSAGIAGPGALGGLSQDQRAQLDLDAAREIQANPDIFGSPPAADAPMPAGSFYAGLFGDAPTPDAAPAADHSDPNDGLYARGGLVGPPPGAYAAGGRVASAPGDNISPAAFGLLRAINPPGPDDQIGALQTGEGVLTAASMKRYPGLLAAANAGTLDPGRVKGLLAPAPAARPRRLR